MIGSNKEPTSLMMSAARSILRGAVDPFTGAPFISMLLPRAVMAMTIWKCQNIGNTYRLILRKSIR